MGVVILVATKIRSILTYRPQMIKYMIQVYIEKQVSVPDYHKISHIMLDIPPVLETNPAVPWPQPPRTAEHTGSSKLWTGAVQLLFPSQLC